MSDDLDSNKLTPADVERVMIEREKQLLEKPGEHPEEVAATLFAMWLPKYCAGVDKLSSNALRRLCKALVEFPLNDSPYNHSSQLERDTFNTGMRLLESKYVMIFHTFSQNIEKIEEEVNKNVPEETNNENNKGEINEIV